jgi:thioredoxin reductase/Pyruvate/2-oxoacid:ferredoxin oxidoreductase delta subunit
VAAGEGSGGEGDDGREHALVRADVCVGCGACVPACPVPGAIRLEGKLAVVDRALCSGHGKCAEACPVGGILLTTGEAVHRVVVPDVGPDFQSNVEGVWIAGELGGRGLIKNAINEGKIAAENVARALERDGRRVPPDGNAWDLAVVGSGPAGLSAGLEALRRGLRVLLLEQGTLADSIRKYPRHKLLLAEPVTVPLYGDLWIADASKETLLEVWEAILEKADLDVRTGHRVESLTREGEDLVVRGEGFEVRARHVVLALGRRGTPRRLGVPGEDASKVLYDVAEMAEFRGRRVLVVGGGDSALESAVGMANQTGTEVTLSYRKAEFARAKPRNVEKLAAVEEAGRVRVLRESVVKEIRPDAVVLEWQGETLTLANDDVVVRIGGVPPTALLERIGVGSVQKEIPIPEAQEAVNG